jgi:Ca-activated chloride channel family protein
MKMWMKKNFSLVPFWMTLFVSLIWLIFFYEKGLNRLFITSNQLAFNQYQKKHYFLAAENFENLSFKGASYYKNAAFKKAKSVYQNLTTKEDTYNLGNVFVMLGEYDNAIRSYERALKIDPNFKEAQENLLVAKARKILKEPENDGEQGVGMMGADEIRYDNTEGKGVEDDKSASKDMAQGNPNWLDRLQIGPKDFLKNKFQYQYQRRENSDAN